MYNKKSGSRVKEVEDHWLCARHVVLSEPYKWRLLSTESAVFGTHHPQIDSLFFHGSLTGLL